MTAWLLQVMVVCLTTIRCDGVMRTQPSIALSETQAITHHTVVNASEASAMSEAEAVQHHIKMMRGLRALAKALPSAVNPDKNLDAMGENLATTSETDSAKTEANVANAKHIWQFGSDTAVKNYKDSTKDRILRRGQTEKLSSVVSNMMAPESKKKMMVEPKFIPDMKNLCRKHWFARGFFAQKPVDDEDEEAESLKQKMAAKREAQKKDKKKFDKSKFFSDYIFPGSMFAVVLIEMVLSELAKEEARRAAEAVATVAARNDGCAQPALAARQELQAAKPVKKHRSCSTESTGGNQHCSKVEILLQCLSRTGNVAKAATTFLDTTEEKYTFAAQTLSRFREISGFVFTMWAMMQANTNSRLAGEESYLEQLSSEMKRNEHHSQLVTAVCSLYCNMEVLHNQHERCHESFAITPE
jgi:hypothetical protein